MRILRTYQHTVLGPPGDARKLLTASTLEAIGDGAYISIGVIYLTRVLGFDPSTVGITLSLVGVLAVVAAVHLGSISDKLGAVRTLRSALIVQAFAVASIALISRLPWFATLAAISALAGKAAYGARGSLMAGVAGKDGVGLRSRMRSGVNLGLAIGGGLGVLALHSDSAWAYRTAIAVNGMTYLLAAVMITRIVVPPADGDIEAATTDKPRRIVFRDTRFFALAILCGIIGIHYGIFTVGMPLWILDHTNAPHSLIGLIFILNTALVVLLQVRLSRGSDGVQNGGRYVLKGTILIAVGYCAFAGAGRISGALSVVVLVAGAIVYTIGEMVAAAGTWGLSYGLSPADRVGEYQSLFGAGMSAAYLIAPLVATTLILQDGGYGWLVCAVVFTGSAFLALLLARQSSSKQLDESPNEGREACAHI